MLYFDRRKKILAILGEEGQISTHDLEQRLGVTGATIRSDLRAMDREGLIIRFHGGAAIREHDRTGAIRGDYMKKSLLHAKQKDAIGKAASNLIRDEQTVFLDASSTVLHIVPYLCQRQNITVVTHGLATALELQRMCHLRTVVIGGVVQPDTAAIEGGMGEAMLESVHGDIYFVSGNGFSPEKGLTGNNFHELELKRICAKKCDRIVALVDASKLFFDSTTTFIRPDGIDTLVTDDGLSAEARARIESSGINLIIAPTCGSAG